MRVYGIWDTAHLIYPPTPAGQHSRSSTGGSLLQVGHPLSFHREQESHQDIPMAHVAEARPSGQVPPPQHRSTEMGDPPRGSRLGTLGSQCLCPHLLTVQSQQRKRRAGPPLPEEANCGPRPRFLGGVTHLLPWGRQAVRARLHSSAQRDWFHWQESRET